ncbi:SusC/RagA family TonB-linked outer membrane protein [Saccharicrinis fermentans]|nr:SusC/RagA family TonB-linked outer membrane protein [Saccharicrinis fermentans]
MNLLVLMLAVGFTTAFASQSYSQTTKLSLKVEKMSLEKFLIKIEEQSEFRFFYTGNINVEKKVTGDFKNSKVIDILDQIKEELQINYEIMGRQIILSPAVPYHSKDMHNNAQQQKVISGKVTDNYGGLLPGVTVQIKGTTRGTITDADGNYIIQNVGNDAVLIFSFIGMVTREVAVEGRSIIHITMTEEALGLDEVVVVGYGTQKKETLTGSIVNVAGAEIQKSPNPNVSANLQGKLPGLVANQRTGEPGRDDPTIYIRGLGTMNDNTPLIIIDGVPRSNMSRMNAEDIESVTVLKDASAAIYGARAANGVILVTTRSGKTGKPVFSLSYNSAFSSPTKLPDLLDAATYAETFNEGEWYDLGRPDDYTPYYSDEVIQKYRDGSDPILYPNTDWVDEVLKDNALQQRVSLSVTGGTDKTRYFMSFAYLDQDGNFKNNPTKYQQYNMRTKIDVDLTDHLTIGANLNALINKKKYSSQGTWTNFYNIIRALPTIPAVYPNGLIAPGRLGENPLLLNRRGYKRVDETPIYTTFTATYKVPFLNGLNIDASYNYDQDNHTDKTWNLPYSYDEYNVNTGEYEVGSVGITTPMLTERYSKWTTSVFNYRISYEKMFDSHKITAMVGQEQQTNTYSWIEAYRQNFVSSAIDQINVGSSAAEDKDNGGSASESAYNNYFGRLNYDYKSKYLAEFLFRYDGSQIFPEGERYGFFPGVSLGWRLSEEEFVKNLIPDIDQLKLRFSTGEIGNDRVGQWQYLQSFSFGHNYVFGTSDVPGIYANTMPNPNITWEVSKKTDIGLDASYKNNLLGMEFTLWKENRSNILASRDLSIPYILGFSGLPDENIGEVNSHGFELILRHRNKSNVFSYHIDGNVAYAESEVVFMDEVPNTESYQDQTGKPIGASLYYEADGIFNTQEEFDAYPHHANSQVGDIKIVDKNDDGVIDSNDRFRYDKTDTPKWVFGVTATMEYKNFDLNLFFQGQAGAVNYFRRVKDLGTTEPANAYAYRAEDRWTVDNPDGTMPRARHNHIDNSTFFLYDATFVRLKNAELGYTLPQNLIARIGLNETRFYVSGSNLLTWAKEITFTDPEVSGESLYYPQLRVINLGVNLKF